MVIGISSTINAAKDFFHLMLVNFFCLSSASLSFLSLPDDLGRIESIFEKSSSQRNELLDYSEKNYVLLVRDDASINDKEYSEHLDENNITSNGTSISNSSSLGLFIFKIFVMIAIIIISMLGNMLVIISVILHRRLHCPANYLLVSLAIADLLVALCAMTFNASMEITGGKWLLGIVMCDLWSSFDVYFSTVSILHLCSISVDRYYAIVKPLEYPATMTNKMLAIMLSQAWLAPVLISFVPIFLGWYTTNEHLQERELNPYTCIFKVNAIYAILSSSVSFWIPCSVMVTMYLRIFQEARKQEKALLNRALSSNAGHGLPNGNPQDIARHQLLIALQGTPFMAVPCQQEILMKSLNDKSPNFSEARSASGTDLSPGRNMSERRSNWRRLSRQGSTKLPCYGRCKMPPLIPPPAPPGRREHKAARTLGLIMGAFVLCWLPFFSWYVTINICGQKCRCPTEVVTTLFWVGYFNSTLNPFIYAYVRSDFRHAFHSTLTRLKCCKTQHLDGVFV